MPRRNHRPQRRQFRRVDGPTPRAVRSQRQIDLHREEMILPLGRCMFRVPPTRMGKLIFANEETAAKALAQAQAKRSHQATGHVEKRYYECPEGGCGGWHLTSRDEYQKRPNAL